MWHEHTREVFSVDWSNINKDLFVSSSWDGTVKLVGRSFCSVGRGFNSSALDSGPLNDLDQ